MADDPSVEALAARAVIGARRDFAGIVASVDPAMTRDALLRLIDALSAAALGDVPDVERTRVATRRRLAGAVVGWLAREGMDPAPFLGCLGAAPALWPPGATAIEAGAAAGPMPRL
jgi:hypothetical protein